jgi:hypothetical protein
MTETPTQLADTSSIEQTGSKSKKESMGRVEVAAWTAGSTGFFVLILIGNTPTWPVAFTAGCVVAMVAFVCYWILNYR